jgi:XPG I-region
MLTSCSSGYGVNANPIEKNILFYALQILNLGIEVHFVFDGGKRLSNGGKLYPGHDPPSQLFRDTLTNIGLPWHQAPAEAEAECAKMETEGVVDGVWSEDGDALAFGCKTLIMFQPKVVSSTENGEDVRKSKTHFKIYKLDNLKSQHPGMDREGFILHAILNGQPKDVGELYDLGSQDVLNAAESGLGKSLCAASTTQENMKQWATTDFARYLKDTRRNLDIPPDFPKWEHVQDYLNPVVSAPAVFSKLPQAQNPFWNEKDLFTFLVDKFQWTITQWVKYVVPVRIVRALLATEEGGASQHDYLKLECDLLKKPTPRKNQSSQKNQITKKVKATFLLCKATSLDTTKLGTTEFSRREFETLRWIIQKSNFNGQRPMTSFLLSPDSARKGKAVASTPGSGRPGPSGTPLTPPSASPSSSNGEGSSERSERTRRSQNPPLSPTPTSRKRKRAVPFAMARATKNISRAPTKNKEPKISSTQANDIGKGKVKEIPDSSNMRANAKRARLQPTSPQDSGEDLSGDLEKRPKLVVEQHPSTPPAQITKPADAINNIIVIDSDSDDDVFGSFPPVAAEQLLSTPPAKRTADADKDFIMLDSDEDESEDDYGSFPSVSQLPPVLGNMPAKIVPDGGMVDDSSGDEYGSFPASPDLRALP